MTRDELYQAVQSYAHRSIDAADFSTFLKLAEARINNDVRSWELRANYVLDDGVKLGPGQFSLPDDFSEAIHVVDEGSNNLIEAGNVTARVNAIRSRAVASVYEIGTTAIGISYPPPDGWQGALRYFKKPAVLANPSDANEVIEKHPQIYLHGVLAELYRWTREGDAMMVAEQNYLSEVENVNTVDARRRWGSANATSNEQNFGSYSGTNGGM